MIKIADDAGASTVVDVITALQFVVDHKDDLNIRVVNLSVSSDTPGSYLDDPLDAAVEFAWHAGIVVVAAAGNRGDAADAVQYAPGNDPFVISVGATDEARHARPQRRHDRDILEPRPDPGRHRQAGHGRPGRPHRGPAGQRQRVPGAVPAVRHQRPVPAHGRHVDGGPGRRRRRGAPAPGPPRAQPRPGQGAPDGEPRRDRRRSRRGRQLCGPRRLDGDQHRPVGDRRRSRCQPRHGGDRRSAGIVDGTTHSADPVSLKAKADLTAAYTAAAGHTAPTLVPADLGGLTLTPGVYGVAAALGLTGTVTLDAQGDPNAAFVFQAGSTLITASASQREARQRRASLQRVLAGRQLRHARDDHRVRRQHPGARVDHDERRRHAARPRAGAQRRRHPDQRHDHRRALRVRPGARAGRLPRAAGRCGHRRQPGPAGRTSPSSRRSSRPASTPRARPGRARRGPRSTWTRSTWTRSTWTRSTWTAGQAGTAAPWARSTWTCDTCTSGAAGADPTRATWTTPAG